ncbi:MAG: phosphoribosylformylglycinamidine synthase subunit PurS [Myxococcales bacterium]|nr:phosphoribosylformylglycinamidine synthase subunit PurS [Myxococcales bacterium]
MKLRVCITPRQDLSDPQSNIVYRTLVHQMGFGALTGATVGRLIELSFDDALPKDTVCTLVQQMCSQLLVNPVMEDAVIEWME